MNIEKELANISWSVLDEFELHPQQKKMLRMICVDKKR